MKQTNASPLESPAKPYIVPALDKGLRIMEYLCSYPEGKSFSDIAATLGISRTTAFTILRYLADTGYVRKGENGNFFISLKVYSLGIEALRHLNMTEILLPELISLRDDLGCTAHAVVYNNRESIVIEKLDGKGTVAFKAYVGERKPLHLSSGGKAILSYLPDEEFDFYATGEFKRVTQNSICNREQLVECRRQVLRDGYSIDNEESEPGVFCIGVPFFSVGNRLIGAVSITTLKTLIDDESMDKYSKRIIQMGENISRRMGYEGKYPLKG